MRRPAALVLLTFILLVSFAHQAFADQVDEGLAACERGDYRQAYRLFKSMAEQGDAYAQTNLAHMYHKGEYVKQDSAQAFKWYQKAAMQGFDQAQYNLGVMYDNGDSVGVDHAEAVSWYRKSAEQGNALAQHNLGVAYINGEGVQRNYVWAYMWLSLTVSDITIPEMRADAEKTRDLVASKMTPAQIAEAQRLTREWKPKKEGK